MKRRDLAFALMVMLAAGAGLSPSRLLAQTAPQEPAAGAAPVPATPPDSAPAWPPFDDVPPKPAGTPAAQDAAPPPAAAQATPPASSDAPPAGANEDFRPDDSSKPAAETTPPAGEPAAKEENAQAGAPAPAPVSPELKKIMEDAAPPAEPNRAETPPPAGEPPAAKAEETAPPKPAEEPAPAAKAEDAAPPKPEAPKPVETVVAPPPPPAPVDPKSVTLKIATWGGAYGESQDRAYFQPFTSRFGYRIKSVTYDGKYADIQAQAGAPEWNLVDLDGESANRACEEKLLEPLDPSMLESAPNGATIAEDFQPGAIRPCAIGSVAWSAVVVYDKRMKRKPESVADFFDLRKFPGKRVLPRQPKYSLELALMADGVAPANVYATLATPEGQDRAFAKLNAIRSETIWWDKPSEVFDKLAKKEAAMGIGFNGRAFMAIVGGRQPVDILWDHQIYSFDYWAIPRGASNQEAARSFIRFATSPGPLSDQTRWMPYGPARRSALQLVGKHAEVDMDMKPYLPTFEPNQKTALAADEGWWSANGKPLEQRFAEWVQSKAAPVRKGDATSQ